jgi:hypothetical protein
MAGWKCWAAAWVNRKVIEAGGLDPTSGRASLSAPASIRLAMLKYGMDDLRAFFDGDVRWLAHYGFAPLDVRLVGRRGTQRKGADNEVLALLAQDHLDTDASVDEIARTLNAIGLEVEGIENPATSSPASSRAGAHRRPPSQCRQAAGADRR